MLKSHLQENGQEQKNRKKKASKRSKMDFFGKRKADSSKAISKDGQAGPSGKVSIPRVIPWVEK